MNQRRAPPGNINLPANPSQPSSYHSAYLTPDLPSPRLGTSPSAHPLGRHTDGTLRSPSYFGSLSSRYDARSLHEQSISASGGRTTRRGRAGAGETNWDTLHEMVGDDEEALAGNDGVGLGLGTNADVREAGQEGFVRRLTSHSTLRSFFSARTGGSSPRMGITRGRPFTLEEQGERGDGRGPLLAGQVTASPPALAGTEDVDPMSRLGGPPAPQGRHRSLSPLARMSKSRNGSSSTLRPDRQASGDRTPLLSAIEERPMKKPLQPKGLWLSPATIAITKCAVAYLIGSLFTFVPVLAHMLSTRTEQDAHGRVHPRPAYSGHLVATIVVYFHPAKSAGNMLLADRYAAILAGLAAVVCILAMLTLHLFDSFSPSLGSKWDWISEAGDWVVNILYIGGSMGLLAWAKVWVANPSFNSGCSMAAVTIYSVVIKEGNLPKLAEILIIVIFGVLISNIVCFTVFPTTATTRLQNSISRSVISFSTLLDLLTSTFLLERSAVKSTSSLRQAIADHAKAFKTLRTDLAEAKHERIIDPRIRGQKLQLYDAAISSLARLAQHLAGMRSSTRLQEGLIAAVRDGKVVMGEEGMSMSFYAGVDVELETNMRLFTEFRRMAGVQLNDLNAKCDIALQAVQTLAQADSDPVDLVGIKQDLLDSLAKFNESSGIAIKQLYVGPRREQEVYENARDESGDKDIPALDEIVDGPNEAVFLIYFFLFTFEEFAREICFLLDTVSEITSSPTPSALDHLRSVLPLRRDKKQRRHVFLYQQLLPIDPSKLQPPIFPRKRPDATAEHPPAVQVKLLAGMKQKWWAFGDWLAQPDKRYAIKIWLGGAILAAPAYTEWGRDWFLKYRGEWALIAFFSVNSPTLGQTNAMSLYRSLGTFIGALVGVIVYSLFPEHPIILPLVGFLFSIPCFYIITQIPEHMQTGRFTILAYNLTCLYAYNSRERDYPVWRIAIFRSATVIIGALWAAIVSRYWWPVTARKGLRLGISDFCLDLSYLYSRLVQTYSKGSEELHFPEDSMPPSSSCTHEADEAASEPLLPQTRQSCELARHVEHSHLSSSVRHFLSMELHLQSQLASLRELLVQTKNEPRIKGPFDYAFYNEVLLSCERMLDRLHSMRCVTTRDEWDNDVRTDFVALVNKERRDMVGSIILYFYTLSAGFSLRTPMPPYLPPAELFRQRLVEAIRRLDIVKRRSVRGGSRHLLYFAYACAMQEVIAELDYLGGMMQDTFGVIGQSTLQHFDDLFTMGTRDEGRNA